MTSPLTPPQSRRLLLEAVNLLDAADHEKDMLAWHGAKDDFLIALAALMGVAGTQGIMEGLKTVGQQTRSARNSEIKRRYHGGEKARDLGVEFEITWQRVHQIAGSRVIGKRKAGLDNPASPRIASQPSQSDSRPSARSNAEAGDTDQIERINNPSARSFQVSSP